MQAAKDIAFGSFRLDLTNERLLQGTRAIPLRPKAFAVLKLLLEHPGVLVTKQQVLDVVWPGTFVGDAVLKDSIRQLREALDDSAGSPIYIETAHRRGYRFIAEIAVVERPTDKQELGHEVPSSGEADRSAITVGEQVAHPNRPGWQPVWKRLGLAMVSVLLVLVAWTFLWRSRQPAIISASRPANNLSSSSVRSLAVLPLENLSSDSQDYFADGMTDELITNLARIGALRVISRSSVMPYKGVRKPLPQIAHELNVDVVVEGTVLRSGDQVRITAQLVQGPSDTHLWAQSYEGDVRDTLVLQKRVARAIAEQIRIKLTPQEKAVLENPKAVSPEAYESYLKGRYSWNKRSADGLKKAIFYYNQAIESDPTYSLPHTGLANIYQVSDDPQLARKEVQKALDLDDQSAEAHNSLARLLYRFDRDWEGADREFKRALELNHNYAPAHHWYSMYLALAGHREQALAEAEKAYELDPLSPVVGANLAKILQEAGQNDKAIEQAKKTLDLEPDSAVTHAVLGIAYQDKRMYAEAIKEYRRALQLGGAPDEMRGLLGNAYAVSGNRTDAEKTVVELKRLWPGHTHAALDLAVVFSGLGDKKNTLYWLGKAHEMHVSDLIGIGQESHFAQLRSDRQFQALVQQVGAPK